MLFARVVYLTNLLSGIVTQSKALDQAALVELVDTFHGALHGGLSIRSMHVVDVDWLLGSHAEQLELLFGYLENLVGVAMTGVGAARVLGVDEEVVDGIDFAKDGFAFAVDATVG